MAKSDEMKRAEAAAQARIADFPRVVKAGYAQDRDRLLIELSTGLGLLVDYHGVEGLERATSDDLNSAEISPSGFGLHFPALDADVYVPGLMEGKTGSAAYMAAQLGAAGGRSRSAAKVRAARENGRLGGRPRKIAAG